MRIAPPSFLLLAALLPSLAGGAPLPTPSEYLKLDIGADRVLADYRQIGSYFGELDRRSPRVSVENLGKSTLGEDLFMAVISSEANIRRLPELKDIARRIADPRGVTPAALEGLIRDGRAFVLVTCTIHSTEIAAGQMAMEWAHALARAEDAETLRRLDQVVLLLVPSLNPDGMMMETEWYRRWLGTRYEGGRMPWLYHHYTGHDDNRDWYMLTQKETKAVSRAVYHEWFPQVWLDEHQMGNTGPRIFVPPYAEPVDADIHPLIWREVNLIGSHMALRLEQARKPGVIYGYSFDAYWPGGTKNTAWFKNISGLLTEVASARIATPMYVEPGELAGGRKGLIEYGAQTNFPNPWPGGWWRLRDIMDYERLASDALLEACADRRVDLLRNAAARASAAIAAATPGEAYRLPFAQHDPASAQKLAALLVEHNVEVFAGNGGDLWVPLAQPYATFVREMLETQRYPEVKLVEGREIVRPYDVSAWSLPLMMGVRVERGTLPANARRWTPEGARASVPRGPAALARGVEATRALNAAVRGGGQVRIARQAVVVDGRTWPAGTAFLDAAAAVAAGRALVPGVLLEPIERVPSAAGERRARTARDAVAEPAGATVAMRVPHLGLYKPWAASMDEGWTRFLLEGYGFAPVSLDNAAIQKGGLRARFDCIVLPDVAKEVIATGKPRREDGAMTYFVDLPPGYTGGLDATGAKALKEFVEAGGTLVAMSASCDYVIEHFNIPVVNALARARPEEFGCPGSLLRVRVAGDHPVTWGLPEEMAFFVDKPLAFQTAPPALEMDRRVLAAYPENPKDVLVSGWIRGEERLTRKSAAVALTPGKGKIVLLGFRPQHRAQTDATFPLLFNAIWWSVM